MIHEDAIYDLDEAWLRLCARTLDTGVVTHPRNFTCYELIGNKFMAPMDHPILSIKRRKLGYRFMLAEAAWILSGDNRVETIAPFSKIISTFSDDGVFFYGAYGPMIVDQLSYVTGKLVQDPESRQAVLSIWRRSPPVTKDPPCTLTIQFLIRNNRLNVLANLRSSDIWLGVPYDFFNFSMLAGYVMLLLRERSPDSFSNLRLGDLHFYAGSHHIYESNKEAVDGCIVERERYLFTSAEFDPLNQFAGPQDLVNHLWTLARCQYDKVYYSDFFLDNARRLFKPKNTEASVEPVS